MQLITRGFIILLVVMFGSSWARPQSEDNDAETTPETIENIFRKYDRDYPFHGGGGTATNDEEGNVQNDAPVMEAIIERLNEIMHDDRSNEFVAPSVDGSERQRNLLRKQHEELVDGGSHRLNRRVKESLTRGHVDTASLLDLGQNVFLNKDLLADTYANRPADRLPGTTTRRTVIISRPVAPVAPSPTRIPIRTTSTRYTTRRPTVRRTTSTAPLTHGTAAAGEKISELIAEELLTKPEGNKLSIPILSVATADFEQDIPIDPLIVVPPNKVSAQTDDYDDESYSRNQYKSLRRQQPVFRRRRRQSGTYDWLMSWFYSENNATDAEEGRMIKRQIIDDSKVVEPTVDAEPVPTPEEVKSLDVQPQVSDAVIETILDIDDPQTRNEFAKDVPAIEEKLEQLEEEQQEKEKVKEAQQTVEVAIVEFGKSEPEELGSVVDPPQAQTAVINESRQVILDSISKAIEQLPTDLVVESSRELNLTPTAITQEEEEVVREMQVLRDQIPDDFARSGSPPPAKIVDIVAAIPTEIISVMTPSETIRDVPEEKETVGRSVSSPVVIANVEEDEVNSTFIEVDRVVPKTISSPTTTNLSTIENIPTPAENIPTIIHEAPKTISTSSHPSIIPIADVALVEDKIGAEGDIESVSVARKGVVENVESVGAEQIPTENIASSAAKEQIVPTVAPRAVDMEMVIEDRRPEFVNSKPEEIISEIIAEPTKMKISVPQIKTPILEPEQEQDFEIVLEPEPEDEPTPKSLNVTAPIATVNISLSESVPIETPIASIPQAEIKEHVVEETVLIGNDPVVNSPPELTKTVEDPTVPLISENVDSRLHSMIITEVLEDENMEVGYNSIAATTTLPLEWLKDDLPGEPKSIISPSSDAESSSVSTTESTSDAEIGTTAVGSSEEVDSKEKDDEKIRKKEEKRRRKEEEKRLKKEEEKRKNAAKKDKSSEEIKETTQMTMSDPEINAEKMTKEEMIKIFSSPEVDMDVRRLDTPAEPPRMDPAHVISEVVEMQKNVSSDHVVIKKDGVEDNDDSEESSEVTTISPEMIEKLETALDKEMEVVEKVLEVIQNAIDTEIKQQEEEQKHQRDVQMADATFEQSGSVITSKNTRHLVKDSYSEFAEKDILPDVAEARLTNDYLASASEKAFVEYNSRSFVLIGSGLFLITGFVLFALVVIIKRSRQYGSLDLTIA